MMRVRIAAVAAAVLVFSVACGDDENPTPTAPTVVTPSPPVVTPPAVVTPQNLTIQGPTWFADSKELAVDQTAQLRANLELSDGSTREDVDAEWTSGNTTVATVSADGLLTGRQPGGFDLRATAEGLTGVLSGLQVVLPPRPSPDGCLERDVTLGTGHRNSYADFRFTNTCEDWIRVFGSYSGDSIRVRFENQNQNEIGFTSIDAFNLRPTSGETFQRIMILDSGWTWQDVTRTVMIGLRVRYRD